jgi:hypothetical protein
VAAAVANYTSRQAHRRPILESVAAAGMNHHSQHVFTRPTLNLYQLTMLYFDHID